MHGGVAELSTNKIHSTQKVRDKGKYTNLSANTQEINTYLA